MIVLNDIQTEHIHRELQQRGLSSQKLEMEVLDHVCCLIEEQMADGVFFHDALTTALQSFDKQGIQVLQEETAKAVEIRVSPLKKIVGFAGAIAASLLLLVMVAQAKDQPDITPVHKEVSQLHDLDFQKQTAYSIEKSSSGVRFKVPLGVPVLATAHGIVDTIVYNAVHKTHGISIWHNEEYETRYTYLSGVKVKKGQRVRKGEEIGFSGSSGAEPCFYYEVLKNGKKVDPTPYFQN